MPGCGGDALPIDSDVIVLLLARLALVIKHRCQDADAALLPFSLFHACPLPSSLWLFPGKDFMSMLPAVPEKFSRREVFLRVLMR